MLSKLRGPEGSDEAAHAGIWPIELPDGGWRWVVVGPDEWELGRPGSGHWLHIEAGFVSNLVTRPAHPLLRWIIDANDPQTARAAIVHDAMLAQGFEQRVAAAEFYRVLIADRVPQWKAKLYFAAVLINTDNWGNTAPLSRAEP